MNDAYIGIDLCFAKRKRLPISICTWRDERLVPEALKTLPFEPPRGHGNAAILDRALVRKFARQAAKYIINACEALDLTPRRIAIDAPSSPCKDGSGRRAAETAMDEAGISCYPTPPKKTWRAIFEKVRNHLQYGGPHNRIPHANQLWMWVGFALFKELSKIAECIEVFPQATARVMGSGQVHKFKSGGVDAQLATAAQYTGWPSNREDEPDFADIAFAPAHDRLDAYLSAWVAALDEKDRIAFGEPPDDVIWTPRIEGAVFTKPVFKLRRSGPSRKSRTSPTELHFSKACPGCGYMFKRWPFGWDAHAAHRCTGLSSIGVDARKAEFKRRFGSHFS